MKSFLVFLIFSFSLPLLSQPQLSPVYQLPDPLDLTVSQLLQIQELITFKHKEGIVIYNQENDQWKLFRCLDQYEELGRIIEIKKINERYIVSLERGGAVVSESKIKTFNSTVLGSFEIKNKILILSGEINPEESANPYFYDLYYSDADRLILYDPEKDETETIIFPKPIYSVKSCELFKDHLWIYAFDEESEYWFPEFLKVDLKGNVTTIESPGTNFNLIRSLKSFENKLFILRDSSLCSISEKATMKKNMDLDPIDRYGVIRNFETGFYIFQSRRGDGYNDITGYTQIDLQSETLKKISLPAMQASRDKAYTDSQIYQDKLFNYCEYYQLVQGVSISEPGRIKDYTIRDGITDYIENLTEDEKETWFIGAFSGIHRYIKTDSTWVNYTQFINYQDDSAGILRMEVFTINKDYVFIPLISDTRGIVKYLLFDRQNEEFMVLNKEEFIRKFLFDGERFVSYTGEEFAKHLPNILNHIIDYQGDVWNLFLFLYELPISGNSGSDHGNLIISNGRCTILSFHMTHPKMWYDGILLKLKDDSTIYFTLAPKSIHDFDHASHPFFIGGDAYRVFAASPGNFAHGLLIYDPSTYSCKTDKIFYQTLSNFSFLQGTGTNVMIGCYGNGKWGKLYSVDILTNALTDLSKYISATPRNCKSTQNFIYVATDEGLVYFDHDLNYLGKLYPDRCKLSKTKHNLYLIAVDKVFLIND